MSAQVLHRMRRVCTSSILVQHMLAGSWQAKIGKQQPATGRRQPHSDQAQCSDANLCCTGQVKQCNRSASPG